ncbi:MAG: glycosyltransferase family 2 protein [Bacteroidales bacterium]|nr:glycosyltransferase family 2 protein [Bacteroidales bacterium]
MTIAVIILNWNGRHMLERFLPSVTRHTTGDARVIIADNGSTDDSLEFLAAKYPQLQVIAFDRNYGFAEGYNKAIAQVEADYYVLLNDDVEVSEGWWQAVVAQMEADPSVAIAQPKLLMYDQRDTFEYAGGAGGFIDKYGYPFCRGRIFSTLEQDHGQYDDAREIFWASGAAMFVKSEAWKALGGLDGDFFAHMEEIDLCWRAKNAGYKVVYCPAATVYHVGGGTLPKSSPFKTQLNFRNNRAMLYKNLPSQRKTWVLFVRFVLDWVAALSFLLKGNGKECLAVFTAHRQYRAWKSNLRRKRAAINPGTVSCIYNGHLLLSYHLFGAKRFSQLRWHN